MTIPDMKPSNVKVTHTEQQTCPLCHTTTACIALPADLWRCIACGHEWETATSQPTAHGGTADMSTPEEMLRDFHQAKAIHGGLMPETPTADIPVWVRDLRIELLAEEVRELCEAAKAGDIVKIADGIADVAYVVIGTAVAYGIPFDAVFAEVHRSNMTKVNTPDEAKLAKGPGYEPPDISRVLRLAADQ